MSEAATVCVLCKKEENDQKKVVECIYCHKCEHLKCKNIIGNAVRKIRERAYFCSLECQEFHQRTTSNTSTETKILRDLQTVLAEVRETKTELISVKNTIGDIEKFQNFLSEKLDCLISDVASLKSEQGVLKADVTTLFEKDKGLSARMESLESNVDRINRAAVSRNAVLLGIPMQKNEETKQIVWKVAAAVGCRLAEGAVVEARRLARSGEDGTKPVPIKITFNEERDKEEFFVKKRNHGKLLATQVDPSYTGPPRTVVLRDELTSFGMKLLNGAREFQGLTDFKFVWPGRNGAILMKKTENSKIEVVRSHLDLERVRNSYLKRQSRGSSSSPEGGPAAKR